MKLLEKKLEIKIDAIKAIQKVLSNRELHAKGFVLQGIPLKLGAPLFLKTLFHEGAINMKKNQSCHRAFSIRKENAKEVTELKESKQCRAIKI